MYKPKINILVRTGYRPVQFKRMMDSITSQTYDNIRVICSYDDDRALSYIPDSVDKVKVEKGPELFFYDNYCNDLKKMVEDGYFFFLDDSDYLQNETVIERLVPFLKGNVGLVVQMDRKGTLKPSNDHINSRLIHRAQIGMPCLVAHNSLNLIADFDGSVGAADYTWIKTLSRKRRLSFKKFVLVCTEDRNNGKMEDE